MSNVDLVVWGLSAVTVLGAAIAMARYVPLELEKMALEKELFAKAPNQVVVEVRDYDLVGCHHEDIEGWLTDKKLYASEMGGHEKCYATGADNVERLVRKLRAAGFKVAGIPS